MKLFKKNKQQEVAEQTRPEGKSVLLQTYISSLVSLILCVSMFMGTSYAWFTSEINNDGNEIYVGILKAGIYKTIDGESKALTNEADSPKLLDSGIRWEPGYTAVETFEIRNDGDLAFKYDLSFAYSATNESEQNGMPSDDIAKCFDVWLYESKGQDEKLPKSYEELSAEGSGWEYLGTLEDLLDGKPILADKEMLFVRDEKVTTPNEGTLDGVPTAHTYKIAIHMSEDANNNLMGKELKLNAKLVAYQMPSEKDSFGNNDYDTVVSSASALEDALKKGDAVLIYDIRFLDTEDCVTMTGGTLNGNYRKITYFGVEDTETPVAVVTTSGGKITKITVDGRTRGGALLVTSLAEDLSVSNSTFSGVYAVKMAAATEGKKVSFDDCTFNGAVQLYGDAALNKCVFEDAVQLCDNTVLTECAFKDGALDVSQLGEGETIALKDCTIGGIDVGDFTVGVSEGVITGIPTQLTVNVDGKLVLATTEG